jgi:hypothetical protein
VTTEKRQGTIHDVLGALQCVYDVTDCSNGAFAYAKPRNGSKFFKEAESLGLLRSEVAVECDGDGWTVEPERCADGYQLTPSGYNALRHFDPEMYQTRRFGK